MWLSNDADPECGNLCCEGNFQAKPVALSNNDNGTVQSQRHGNSAATSRETLHKATPLLWNSLQRLYCAQFHLAIFKQVTYIQC